MSSIVTMVLASQPGEGFATSRWLAPVGGEALLQRVLRDVRAWPAEPGLVVLGSHAEEVLEAVDFAGFSVLIDPEWEDGEQAAVRAGLDFLGREWDGDAVVIASADMPLVPPEVVPRLVETHGSGRRGATVAKYRYARGRPLVIGRDLWPRLIGMGAGTTVEGVLATHPEWVTEVWIDHLPPTRIATPADLVTLSPRR